jgi:O-antigen/teichoic acid export membrane protein
MIMTRGLGLCAAAAGSIWAARCLGPDKLGISGMIIAVITPTALFVDLNQNVGLIRDYKNLDTNDDRRNLVASVFCFRASLAIAYMVIAALLLWFLGVPAADWRLGIIAAFPLLFFTVNQATWILQGQERVPAQYIATLSSSIISSTSYFLIFRPHHMHTGSDIVVMACAVASEFSVGWVLAMRPLRDPSEGFFLFSFLKSCLASWRRAARMYLDGRWLAISGVVAYIYVFFQTPLVGSLLGTAALGQYRTSLTLINGFQAFAVMVPALLYPRMIEWNRQGPEYLWQRQWQIMRVAMLFFVPGAIAGFVFSPILYKLLYGPIFLPAAYPFAMLLVSKMIVILNGIFSWGLWAQGRDRAMLTLTSIAAAASLGLNFLLIPMMGIFGAATVCMISELLILGGTILYSYRGLRTVAPAPLEAVAT